MDGSAFMKGFKNISSGVKRTAERASVEVRKAVGLSNSTLPNKYPQYDSLAAEFKVQTRNLDSLHHDALTAYEAIQRTTGTACSLAAKLRDSLSSQPSSPSYVAAEALYAAHAAVVDDILPRVERRVKKRVIDPTKEELAKARQVAIHIDDRKRCLLDAARYHDRVADGPSASHEDSRKAQDKLTELDHRTNELMSVMSESIKRRAALIDRLVAETFEFQRRFYVDSSRTIERALEAVGTEKLAAIRGSSEDLLERRNPQSGDRNAASASNLPPRPSHSTAMPEVSVHDRTSIWNELDDDDDVDYNNNNFTPPSHTDNIFESPQPSNSKSDSKMTYKDGFRESGGDRSYPSTGVGHRESAGGYSYTSFSRKELSGSNSSSSVGNDDCVSSYPTGGSRHRGKSYANARGRTGTKPPPAPTPTPSNPFAPSSRESEKLSKPNEGEADLLGMDDPQISSRGSKSKRTPSTPRSSLEDLLDLGGGSSHPIGHSASSPAKEGDLLGDLSGATASSGTGRPSSQTRNPSNPATSFSAPSVGDSVGSSRATSRSKANSGKAYSSTDLAEKLERETLRRKHEMEIKARADEKLAAVREREEADAKEREQKDSSRTAAQKKIDQWTGNGTRRGNLRALLASLDTVLYSGATWKPITMETLKENSKVKVNYHKAILQVHPDKINSKNLSPEQQMLAELVFDELKNGYEVWTAECEGRPPPAGSVGPKGGNNSKGGFGMGGMRNMYSNMGGRGGANGMGMGMGMGMNGMGRGGVGTMGGMGRMGGMNGGGLGGVGMAGMGAMGRGSKRTYVGSQWGSANGSNSGMAGTGRRGTGMGNTPHGYGR